jgi:hypothetical protein
MEFGGGNLEDSEVEEDVEGSSTTTNKKRIPI